LNKPQSTKLLISQLKSIFHILYIYISIANKIMTLVNTPSSTKPAKVAELNWNLVASALTSNLAENENSLMANQSIEELHSRFFVCNPISSYSQRIPRMRFNHLWSLLFIVSSSATTTRTPLSEM
jgi:hypothetical protein